MVTGSLVSSLQGEPRSTHDIDIVIALPGSAIKNFVAAFPAPEYYLPEAGIVAALKEQSMFNLIDVQEGGKVDFWILTRDPFDQSRFSRKYGEDFLGLKIQVSRPEDTILAKLKWAKLSGGSEKQFLDALRVYEVQSGKLDLAYLNEWVKILGLESLWKRLTEEAEAMIPPG